MSGDALTCLLSFFSTLRSGALARGQEAALKILDQHQQSNAGQFPETVAVTLWGLDAIKTRGESVAILLALVGAKPILEGTGWPFFFLFLSLSLSLLHLL